MSELAERIAKLTPEQRILLEERLLAAQPQTASDIPKRSDVGPVPLSYTQERLWFLAQLEPDSPAYNETQVIRMKGALDIPALEQSLDLLHRRHDSLHTCIQMVDGKPFQVIQPLSLQRLEVVDLSDHPADGQMTAAWQKIYDVRDRVFDLTDAPLWRILLIRLAQDDHIFVRVVHHIITDGWSNGIFWRELRALYGPFSVGDVPPQLAELPISYADFAVWQRETIRGDRLTQLTDYWRSRLEGVEPLLFPTDYPRPARPTHIGRAEEFQLSAELSDKLRLLARSNDASLYMLFMTAFQVLLHRYTGQDDIIVGSPIASRTRVELETVYGFFANTLVMRTNCSGNPTFRDLLDLVRKSAVADYQYQDLPFEKLVEVLNPVRDTSRSNPFFDISFAFQNLPGRDKELAGIHLSRLSSDQVPSKFDIGLFLQDQSGYISGRIEFAADLFASTTVRRLIGHYRTILEAVAHDPECPIDRLPMLTEEERRQLFVEWNDTESQFPQDKPVGELFTLQVTRSPNSAAITGAGQQITYTELNERANQLARYLQKQGATAGQTIGVCMERTSDMVIALLSILKVGCTYLPLDSTYPRDRLLHMIEDSGVHLVLAHRTSLSVLSDPPCEIIMIDGESHAISTMSVEEPETHISPTVPAYITYTSGSTGIPKGIVIPHRAISRLVCNTNYIEIGPSDVVAQASTVTFDAATFEIWGALLNGASLTFVDKETLLNPKGLAEELLEKGITILFVTTALFNYLVDENPSTFVSLRALLFGGEASSPTHVANVLNSSPPEQLIHVYGPTEATTFSTYHPVKTVDENLPSIPIGKPIANTSAIVLDKHHNPVPIGVPGELYIGGPGLAIEYVNNPELTDEQFVQAPFAETADERFYRTGDIVYYLPDGNIQFIGRLDNQIKLRGHRIELGEIEALFSQHPSVKTCVVDVQETEPGTAQLVAYWVPDGEKSVNTGCFQDHLSARLPDYMVPRFFVEIDALPLSPQGKVDRRALPAVGINISQNTGTPSKPADEVERKLIDIWESLLKLSPIGLKDDFFDLGGHSLLSIRLLTLIEDAFGVRLPVADLFNQPTIMHTAAMLRCSLAKAAATPTGSRIAPAVNFADIEQNRPREVAGTTYSLPRRAMGRMLFTGPLIATHPLPYAIGTRLQRAWLRLPLVRNELVSPALYLRRWFEIVGEPGPDSQQLEVFRLANTWRLWRDACIRQPEVFDRWVDLVGVEHVLDAVEQRKPRILIISHIGFGPMATILAVQRSTNEECFLLGGSFADNAYAVAKLEHALGVLQRGGSVVIAGDGSTGVTGITVPIFEQPWHYKLGAAELAVQTGASFIPVFSRLSPTGRLMVEFVAPLVTSEGLPETQVEDLTLQYAGLYEQRWVQMLPNMKWHKLRQMLA